MGMKWRTLGSRIAYENPWYRIREDRVIRPDGTEGVYGVLERGAAVLMIPRKDTGEIYFLKEYRYPIQQYSFHLPAGTADPGERPEIAARRELEEETGITGRVWTSLGRFYIAPGYSSQIGYAYLVENLVIGNSHPEGGEDIQVELFTLPEIRRMIQEEIILDQLTITAIYKLELFLQSSRQQTVGP
jgi:8-oxo-dGTP pyrophosphatase MutT (NUDIX family)